MVRLDMEARTLEWQTTRAESWTESVAATLVCRDNAILLRDCAAKKGVTLDIDPLLAVGVDSYFGKTLWQAWADKMGIIPRVAGCDQADREPSLEALVIQHFETERLMVVERDVSAVASTYSGLLASMGALAPASSDPAVMAPYGFPVEARCLAYGARKRLFESRTKTGFAILGMPDYWCHVQHQLLVTEAPYGWFVAAGVEEDAEAKALKVIFPVLEKVPRDDRFLAAYAAAARFYHQEFLESYIEPPKLPSDEALLRRLDELAVCNQAINESNFDVVADLYLAAKAAELEAETRRKELEARLLQSADAMRAKGSDLVSLTARLQVVYSKNSAPVGWQKVAKTLAGKAGLSDIPPDIIEACTGKATEKVKFQEVF